MRRTVARSIVMCVGVLGLGCADFDAPVAATDETAESGTTGEAPTTSASMTGTPVTTSSSDETGPPSTTTDDPTDTTVSTDTTNTTGGCMPGVFGESRFGEACFQ